MHGLHGSRILSSEGASEIDAEPVTESVIEEPTTVHLVYSDAGRNAYPHRGICDFAIAA